MQFKHANYAFFFTVLKVLESAWRVPEWQSMKEALAQVRSPLLSFTNLITLGRESLLDIICQYKYARPKGRGC